MHGDGLAMQPPVVSVLRSMQGYPAKPALRDHRSRRDRPQPNPEKLELQPPLVRPATGDQMRSTSLASHSGQAGGLSGAAR